MLLQIQQRTKVLLRLQTYRQDKFEVIPLTINQKARHGIKLGTLTLQREDTARKNLTRLKKGINFRARVTAVGLSIEPINI